MSPHGTPFITLQEPLDLSSYNRRLPPSSQPASIPRTFLDAMAVREAVFVREQGVPLDNELDADDARSCHWVVYASVGGGGGEAASLPIGTLRLVPFPHPPHPIPGASYEGGNYVGPAAVEAASEVGILGLPEEGPAMAVEEEGTSTAETTAVGMPASQVSDSVLVPDVVEGGSRTVGTAAVGAVPAAGSPRLPGHGLGLGAEGEGSRQGVIGDRATSLHDGREPYVKLGRLAVLPAYRGHRIGRLLVEAALEWLRAHQSYFDPSVAAEGFERLGIDRASEIPRFAGLVCAHAQVDVQGAWARMGFEVDDQMGKWWEEGIPHVGMWLRVVIPMERPEI